MFPASAHAPDLVETGLFTARERASEPPVFIRGVNTALNTKSRIAALLALIVALAGCAPTPVADQWSTVAEADWSVYGTLLSSPMVVEDVVLVYEESSRTGSSSSMTASKERLVAYDVSSGTELWSRRTVPGRTSTGSSHQPAVAKVDDEWQVAALVPEQEDAGAWSWSRFLILDVRTGEVIDPGLEKTQVWAYRPFVCRESEFCIVGNYPGSRTASDRVLQYSPADQKLAPATAAGAPFIGEGEPLIGDLSILETRGVQYGNDGEILWTRPFAEVFGPRSSPDATLSWRDVGDGSLLIAGFPAPSSVESHDGPTTESLVSGTVSSIDKESGETVWRLEGARPCAVADHHIRVEADVIVLCRYDEGTVTSTRNGTTAGEFAYEDVAQTMFGIDVGSGEEVWSLDLGADAMNVGVPHDRSAGWMPGSQWLLVSLDGRAHLVDPATGATSGLPDDAVLLCRAAQKKITLESIWSEPLYFEANKFTTCDSSGRPFEKMPPSVASLAMLGYDTNQPVVINLANGLTAFLPDSGE